MPVHYEPRHFFSIVFARIGTGDAWCHATGRAFLMMPIPVACAVLDYYDYFPTSYSADESNPLGVGGFEFDDLCLPFTFFLGIVTAFRLNDAFKKWERATELMLTLHRHMRNVVSRLCSTLPVRESEEVADACLEIRRLLLLGCCLMKAHVRGETDSVLDETQQCGLLMQEERERLLAVATIASGPTGDGKRDKFPTRSRPMFAFQEASYRAHELFKAKHFTCPHTYWGIETSITAMADTFEDAEHLATSLMPIPYAQTARLLMLCYLILMPMAYVRRLGMAIIPLSLVTNCIYFLIDDCSAQMERPFGNDENDVAVDKTIRRIDKLSAAQMTQALPYSRRPVMNYNLYPESRSTDGLGNFKRKRGSSMGDTHHPPPRSPDGNSFMKMASPGRTSGTASVLSSSSTDAHEQQRVTVFLEAKDVEVHQS